MKYQITYKDALKICEAYKNFNFYATEHMFDKYKVVTFNYFLCEYKNFVRPLENEPQINARDMRGVTFVFNEDGTLYKRFLMLEKFFNVNQVEETQINVLKSKKIKNVTIKEDGSLIAFMQLPNGEIFAKTQAGFTNEQSSNAMQLYNHQKGVKGLVDEALEANLTPLFEYVAYDNRIVLKYSKKELRLIGVRDNKYGEFFSAAYTAGDIMTIEERWGVPYVKSMKFNSLDEIDALMKTSTDMEGVVVEFEDGMLVKWKTNWYWNAHQFRDDINRENNLIKMIINNTIDDFLSTIDEPEYMKQIKDIQTIINDYFIRKNEEIYALCKLYEGNRKDFVISYKGDKNFSLAIKHIFGNKDIKIIISEYLIAKTRKLTDARIFLAKRYI